MPRSQVDKRLKRLAESNNCCFEEASGYSQELKELADRGVSKEDAAKKSKIYKALADSTRLRILGLLMAKEMCVCEVMAALDLTQPTASHHLHILENCELIKSRKEGKWVFYDLINPSLIADLLKIS